jgi:predicted nucleotidyltransferase
VSRSPLPSARAWTNVAPCSYPLSNARKFNSRKLSGTEAALADVASVVLCWNGNRIDPKGTIGGCPALVVRKTLRYLRVRDQWGVAELEATAGLAPGTGIDLTKALQAEGLIESCARDAWCVTQAGRTFSVATAARPVTRATAERALAQFLDRVGQVNRDPYFLGKVVRVVLFGSMLKPEVARLSDVDVAVELATKETDFDRARAQNYLRAEELAQKGKRFRDFIDLELCWYFETRHFLKGGSRVIAMADYKAEKALVLAVPHRVLLGDDELLRDDPKTKSRPLIRSRRPWDCAF